MKKFLLSGMVILMSITLQAQKCGDYIDLLGKGIYQESKATIELSDFIKNWKNVDFILAEAVYKSDNVPVILELDDKTEASVRFFTGDENDPVQEVYALPVSIESDGEPAGKELHVFRAKFDKAASSVSLDILKNVTDFYSFVLYVYRKDGKVYTVKAGELLHVWQNGPDGYTTTVDIPKSEHARDILFRFGITELDEDTREAFFSFHAEGEDEMLVVPVQSYDPEAGISYIMKEALLEAVPGDVEKVSMTMLSRKKSDYLPDGDDSFIAGVVLVDLPCEKYKSELLCSFTQGFYGNEGGKMCGMKGTRDLLMELMYEDDLIMGLPHDDIEKDNSLTINAGQVDCILDLLPGGGPSKALDGRADCTNLVGIELNNKGRIKNSLLAQGITLSLNTRLSDELLEFPVDGTEFVTLVAVDCFDPESGGIPGTEKTYAFSPELVDKLDEISEEDPTINDLLKLVNMALGGGDISPLSLSQVSDAANLVNEAFDECVVVVDDAEIMPVDGNSGEAGSSGETDEENAKQEGTKGVTGVSDYKAGILGIYPNPAIDYFNLKIPSTVDQVEHAAIYSLTGVKVMDIDQPIMSGVNQVIEINVSDLNKGVYFVRIQTAAGFVNERFGVQ